MGKKKKKNKKIKKKSKGQLGKKRETAREKMIGQTIGYRYDVNLLPDYKRLTPFLKKYIEAMGWDDLNWLEDVHMGYEEDRPAVFDRNANGWVTIPKKIKNGVIKNQPPTPNKPERTPTTKLRINIKGRFT